MTIVEIDMNLWVLRLSQLKHPARKKQSLNITLASEDCVVLTITQYGSKQFGMSNQFSDRWKKIKY